MAYFIRKIERSLWAKTDPVTGDVIADAITNCLNTRKNSLSFWKIDNNTQVEINEVVKAIAASFTSGVDTFDMVILADSDLASMTLNQTNSPTPYSLMSQSHFDLVDLKLSSLNYLANLINKIVESNNVTRYTKATIKTLLREAIEADAEFLEKIHPNTASSLTKK